MNVFLRSVIFGIPALLLGAFGLCGLGVQWIGELIHDSCSFMLKELVNFAVKIFPNKQDLQ